MVFFALGTLWYVYAYVVSMLTVSIRSVKCLNTLPAFKLDCIITPLYRSILDASGTYQIEPGFKLEFRSVSNSEFKDNIWPYLKDTYNLSCAFVIRDGEYMGCILNWPGVFCIGKCPTNLL
jgi:hypothetical protein